MQSSKILISFFSNQKRFICSAKWHTDVFWLETHILNRKIHSIFSFQRSLGPPQHPKTSQNNLDDWRPEQIRDIWLCVQGHRAVPTSPHSQRQTNANFSNPWATQNGCWLQSNSEQQPALHCKHHLFIWVLLSFKRKKKKKKKTDASCISCVRKRRLNVLSELQKKEKELERS